MIVPHYYVGFSNEVSHATIFWTTFERLTLLTVRLYVDATV